LRLDISQVAAAHGGLCETIDRNNRARAGHRRSRKEKALLALDLKITINVNMVGFFTHS
jgi:hypothetical protein